MPTFKVYPAGREDEGRDVDAFGFATAAVAYHEGRVLAGTSTAGGTHRIVARRADGQEAVFDLRVRSLVVEVRTAE